MSLRDVHRLAVLSAVLLLGAAFPALVWGEEEPPPAADEPAPQRPSAAPT